MSYLTQKMRNKEDLEFNYLCDRVADNDITDADEMFLQSRVMDTESEKDNENGNPRNNTHNRTPNATATAAIPKPVAAPTTDFAAATAEHKRA